MSYAKLATFVLMLAATAQAAGCGGSSKAGSTSASGVVAATETTQSTAVPTRVAAVKIASGKPLSRRSWIAKGEEICGRLNAELASIKIRVMAEIARVLPQATAYERTAIGQLAKLVPPASKAHDWQQFLTESLQFAENSARLVNYARLGDSITRSPLAVQTRELREHLIKIPKRDGFKECARVF